MEEDRISQLPDELLQHILSLIHINQAVQTSILSKRWKNQWLSISDLHFHLTAAAAHSHVSLENYQTTKAFSLRFSHFTSQFLSHRHAAAARTFHLSLGHRVPADAEFVEECLRYAVNHGVESLRLHVRCIQSLTLPSALFASTTLRELELELGLGQKRCGLCVVGRFFLPHLKSLHLESVVFYDDGHSRACSKEPFSGFPELEKLSLRWFRPSAGVVLRAPKLRFLEIIEDDFFSCVEISAPLLTSFRYEGYLPFECSEVNLPMLEEVYLNICRRQGGPARIFHEKWNGKCVRMLELLGNAKFVTLTLDTLKVLEKDIDDHPIEKRWPPPFPGMKCLKVVKWEREIPTVLQSVMKYLTVGTLNLVVEFPSDVAVVKDASQDLYVDEDDIEYLEVLALLMGTSIEDVRRMSNMSINTHD